MSALVAVALLLLIMPSAPADAQFGLGTGGSFNGGGFNFGGGCGFQGGFGNFQGGFQGGCGNFQGGFNAPPGGNFQGGFNQGGGNFNQGFNQGGSNFNQGFNQGFSQGFNQGFQGGGFNGGCGGFGLGLAGGFGCTTGIFGLIPDAVAVEPGVRIPYQLVWVTPTVWPDLELLDLRIRDQSGTVVALIRWIQATNEFQIVDPTTGQVLGRGPARGRGTIENGFLTVLLSETSAESDGPTAPAVGLSIAITLKPSPADRLYGVDVGAKSDTGTLTYELAGLLFVLGDSQRGPGDTNDDDKPRKLTEEQRQQKERTNRSSQDDYRTEGNAVASDCAADSPTVTIANRDGNVVLNLLHDARESCRLVQPGDYVEAIGEKQHEQLYDVDQLTVRRNGTRVR